MRFVLIVFSIYIGADILSAVMARMSGVTDKLPAPRRPHGQIVRVGPALHELDRIPDCLPAQDERPAPRALRGAVRLGYEAPREEAPEGPSDLPL